MNHVKYTFPEIEYYTALGVSYIFIVQLKCIEIEILFQVRVARIQQIEKDILRIRQLLQSQAAEAEVSVYFLTLT